MLGAECAVEHVQKEYTQDIVGKTECEDTRGAFTEAHSGHSCASVTRSRDMARCAVKSERQVTCRLGHLGLVAPSETRAPGPAEWPIAVEDTAP